MIWIVSMLFNINKKKIKSTTNNKNNTDSSANNCLSKIDS